MTKSAWTVICCDELYQGCALMIVISRIEKIGEQYKAARIEQTNRIGRREREKAAKMGQ